jgi:hypothetical protein
VNVTTVVVVLVGEDVVIDVVILYGIEMHTDGGGDGHGNLALG